MKYILIALILLAGCSSEDMGSYDYSPYKNLDIKIDLKKAKYYKEHKSTFLFFKLQIINGSSEEIYLDPGRLQVKVNKTSSEATYDDSLASALSERKVLNKGESDFNLYFVLPGVRDLKSVDNFEVLNFGLDQGKDANRL